MQVMLRIVSLLGFLGVILGATADTSRRLEEDERDLSLKEIGLEEQEILSNISRIEEEFASMSRKISWIKVNEDGVFRSDEVFFQDQEDYTPTSRSSENCECGKSLYGTTSCGDTRRAQLNRIIGGRFARFNEIPWQARVVICRKDNSCYTCGGTLINHQYVLSAAHCLKDKGRFALIAKMSVQLGLLDVRTTTSFTVRSGVDSFNIHGKYEEKIVRNDIALIKLKNPVKFTRGVRPICLASNVQEHFINQWAVVSGWGQISVNHPAGSNVLKRTSLKVLNNNDQYCINGAGIGRVPWIKQLCAYSEGTDSCGGDSGGPLTLPQGSRCYQVGIVSYGIKCALTFHAGVYTRITEYIDWIKHIAKDGGCMDTSGGSKRKYCNMRCRWGRVTTTYYVTNSRYKVVCNDGICYAENPNVDLCRIYNTPCGPIWQ